MDYFTKTIVLHQVEKGFSLPSKPFSVICRIEYNLGIYRCYVTFNNFVFNPDGTLCLMIYDSQKQTHYFPLENFVSGDFVTFSKTPSVKDSLSIGIFFLENNIPLLIAFCKLGGGIELSQMKKILYDRYIKSPVKLPLYEEQKTDYPKIAEENKFEIDESIFNKSEEVLKDYNDEALATENYYNDEEELKKQLEFIERFENDSFGNENENDERDSFKQDGKGKNEKDAQAYSDEKHAEGIAEYSERNPFYSTVKSDVEDLLAKFPEEPVIKRAIPNSKFVRINYAENKYYVVGIVFDGTVEKYICYGVPDKNNKTPPKELKGYCRYVAIPLSPFEESGYWMMFQDAITGDCIKLK